MLNLLYLLQLFFNDLFNLINYTEERASEQRRKKERKIKSSYNSNSTSIINSNYIYSIQLLHLIFINLIIYTEERTSNQGRKKIKSTHIYNNYILKSIINFNSNSNFNYNFNYKFKFYHFQSTYIILKDTCYLSSQIRVPHNIKLSAQNNRKIKILCAFNQIPYLRIINSLARQWKNIKQIVLVNSCSHTLLTAAEILAYRSSKIITKASLYELTPTQLEKQPILLKLFLYLISNYEYYCVKPTKLMGKYLSSAALMPSSPSKASSTPHSAAAAAAPQCPRPSSSCSCTSLVKVTLPSDKDSSKNLEGQSELILHHL